MEDSFFSMLKSTFSSEKQPVFFQTDSPVGELLIFSVGELLFTAVEKSICVLRLLSLSVASLVIRSILAHSRAPEAATVGAVP